jgi:phosphoribosylformylglycinamidine synthase
MWRLLEARQSHCSIRASGMSDIAAYAATVGISSGVALLRSGRVRSEGASGEEVSPVGAASSSAAPPQRLATMFRTPLLGELQVSQLVAKANRALGAEEGGVRIAEIRTEVCFYIDLEAGTSWDSLSSEGAKSIVAIDRSVGRRQCLFAAKDNLAWVLRETFEPRNLGGSTFLPATDRLSAIVEVGPRMTFTSAFSTNAVSICQNCGIPVRRLERFRRYWVRAAGEPLRTEELGMFASLVHDRMTEWVLPSPPLERFHVAPPSDPTRTVPVLERGTDAIRDESERQGLSFDDADVEYLFDLFARRLKRDPTTVELFDFSQSNSEHSRHWFFKGKLVIDGEEQSESLMDVVSEPQRRQPDNSVVAFKDNSSAIRGFSSRVLVPDQPGAPSSMRTVERVRHLLLTAETHNFPSGVAPFPGAETGTGGRLRDTHATGTGSLVAAGVCGYCVGALQIPGYPLPWETDAAGWAYPPNLAKPLQIEIEASNGASDYGNKFGEPVVSGFTRSFGLRMPGADDDSPGARREWVKPIMFSAGVGQLDDAHVKKGTPEPGMVITKIGGPAYRIGMGGSAASSMVQGENKEHLDLDAVQRGDAEMENKLNRVVRACVELGESNPIVSIHDQGAGGNCNVLKEICEPRGGSIELSALPLGDSSLSQREIWGAEYQENDALLLRPGHDQRVFTRICERERLPVAYVGTVTEDPHIVVTDARDGSTPFRLDVDTVLGGVPRKTFALSRTPRTLKPLDIDWDGLTVEGALDRVLRLVSVGSKRFLTNKVDRSVTGLVAQQQCVGPLHTPLADVAVVASSHFERHGLATAVGEQPIKGLLSPAAMARLAVAEAVTNLMFAGISKLTDVKCSANWMWAAKMSKGGEGAELWDAAVAMREIMLALGIAVDGGKDSLSMAAKCPDGETVKSPGELTITLYAPCPEITHVATPDLKAPGRSKLVYIDLSGRSDVRGLEALPRLGGTSVAHVFGQVGDVPPDVDDSSALLAGFAVTQELIRSGWILAGHDVSDGGLLTTVLEMAFAGNCGVSMQLLAADEVDAGTAPTGVLLVPGGEDIARRAKMALFHEEVGAVLEVLEDRAGAVLEAFRSAGVPAGVIATTWMENQVTVEAGEETLLDSSMTSLRDVWEATSFELEMLQSNPVCVAQERDGLKHRKTPAMHVSFVPEATPAALFALPASRRHSVCVLREEGSNGDREMAAAFYAAGMDPWDVSMSDLVSGSVTLDRFRGIAFVGGFSYGDVLDSAKGWAASIRLNKTLAKQFEAFRDRPNTFSLGVCNGCQLLSLLGWVPYPSSDECQPRFVHNESRRYESRFVSLRIQEGSPSVLLRGMGGSVLGVWVAHGEGRARFPDASVLERAEHDGLAPLRYVDDDGEATEVYPFNPNGSPRGIAGLCSPDGRHLALMPHPERCVQMWQWPWAPASWSKEAVSPWMRLFQNARVWCDSTGHVISALPDE